MEENEVDSDFYGRKTWHQEPFLDKNTKVKYHFSYGLGWVAFFFCFLAFIFFALAAWSTRRKKDQDAAGITKPSQQQQQQQQSPQQPISQSTTSQDGTVYVINHYPSTEKLLPNQGQPQIIQQPQMYPTRPVHTSHTVYQSTLPRGY